MFKQDMRPSYRSLPSQPQWERLPSPATHTGGKASDKYREMRERGGGEEERTCAEDDFVLHFRHKMEAPEGEALYFAFCFPLSYTDSIARLAWLDALFGLPAAAVLEPQLPHSVEAAATAGPPTTVLPTEPADGLCLGPFRRLSFIESDIPTKVEYEAWLKAQQAPPPPPAPSAAAAAAPSDVSPAVAPAAAAAVAPAATPAAAAAATPAVAPAAAPAVAPPDAAAAPLAPAARAADPTAAALGAALVAAACSGSAPTSPRAVAETAEAAVALAAAAAPTTIEGEVYYHRELLTRSIDGRRIDLVTISGEKGMLPHTEAPLPELVEAGLPTAQHAERSRAFGSKPTFLLTSRVHPGETPASHVLDGTMCFLLSDDPRARALRDAFVFKLIPMINPDGVYRGHYRSDALGVNLNRVYAAAEPSHHPAVFAICALVRELNEAGALRLYVDCHAHSNKRGCFLFGNALPESAPMVENVLYARLVAENSRWLDFDGCVFSRGNMTRPDRRVALSGNQRSSVVLSGNQRSSRRSCVCLSKGRMLVCVPAPLCVHLPVACMCMRRYVYARVSVHVRCQ